MSRDLQMIYRLALKQKMRVENIAKGWFEIQGYIEPDYRVPAPEYVRIIMKYRIEQ